MPKHPFKWKSRGGSGHLQLAPREVQQSGGEPGTLINTDTLTADSWYHSSNPLVHLLGHATETKVVVEGVETMALVDTEFQISSLTEEFCTDIGLKILPLRNLIRGVLHLKRTGDILILYKGYVWANLTIPDISQYNEDVLFLVVSHHKYGERHPGHRPVGSNHDQKGIAVGWGNRYTSAPLSPKEMW